MNARKRFLWICVIASLVLLVFVSWKQFGSTPSAPGTVEVSAAPGAATVRETAPGQAVPAPATVLTTADSPPPPPVEPVEPWEEKLDSILRSTEPESAKATNLLSLFAKTSGDAQEEVARHLVNLLSDEQFPATVPWLTSTNTPEPVLSVLVNDLLNRPEKLKLPLFLEVARVEGHPNAEEAKSYLEVYVDHDYGTNWDEWAKAIEKHLKEKPEEPEEKPN